MFAGKKSAQIREILISESAWEEMTCLFAPSLEFSSAAYNNENPPSSSSRIANTLYSFFVHDIQRVDHASSISEDFFLRRSSEMPDDDSNPLENKGDGKKHTRRDD
nr:hypothetical protein [Citrobacter freundii]